MSKAPWLCATALLALSASACAPAAPPIPPPGGKLRIAPLVPVSLEAELVAARYCKRIGMTSTAMTTGNVVIVYVQSTSTYTQTVNGVGGTTMQSGFTGFDYKCPKAALHMLVVDPSEDDEEEEEEDAAPAAAPASSPAPAAAADPTKESSHAK